MPSKQASDRLEYEVSSGNVFADLGLPDPEALMAKALLSIAIERAIEERGLAWNTAADLMECTEEELSCVVRGKLEDFSMERLFRFLNALGMDVRIEITPMPDGAAQARTLVTAA